MDYGVELTPQRLVRGPRDGRARVDHAGHRLPEARATGAINPDTDNDFRIEGAFIDRMFIVYKPTGLTPSNQHRPPEIVNIIKVIDFSVDARNGCQVVLKDEQTQQELAIGHVPRRVYAYPIYMSVPAKLTVRWDGRRLDNGRVWRSLSFAVLIKTKNKSDFYSKGNVYVETPNRLKQLYPK